MAELVERFLASEAPEEEAKEAVNSRHEHLATDQEDHQTLTTYAGFKAQLGQLTETTNRNMEDYEHLVASFQEQLQAFICFYETKTSERFEAAMKLTEAMLSDIDQELTELKSVEQCAHSKYMDLGEALLGEKRQREKPALKHFHMFSEQIELELAALAKSQADFQDLVRNAKDQIKGFTSFYVANINSQVQTSFKQTMDLLDEAENETFKLKQVEIEVNCKLQRLKSVLQSAA